MQRQQLHILQLLRQQHVEQQQPRRRSGRRRRHDVREAAASDGGRPPASRGRRSGAGQLCAPPSKFSKFSVTWPATCPTTTDPRVGDVPCCVSRGMLPP
eukprot:6225138-Prymnesium_polylepis.1